MPAGQSRAALTFDKVACLRGGRLLFSGVSFTVTPGDALLLTGPNGVGKSSLLRLAAGLLSPFAGTVTRAVATALADENIALDRDKRLADALAFWAAIDGRGRAAVDDALSAFGIRHLADVPVRMLSTGQRKRATLARVFASGAPLWLLDEPTNGLDRVAITQLQTVIADFRARGGMLVAASHVDLAMPGRGTLELRPPRAHDQPELAA